MKDRRITTTRRIKILVMLLSLLYVADLFACPVTPDPGSVRISSITTPIPQTGNHNLLVILVDFADQPGSYLQTTWQNQFFGSLGSGTFANYFSEISYGQLNYNGGAVGIVGGVPVTNYSGLAYVRMPFNKTYYTNGSSGAGGAFPQNHLGVYYHAILMLDAAGFNFTPFADPLTNKLENVVVVFAGKGSGETSSVNDFSATSYLLEFGIPGGYTTTAGYIANNYTFCPEQYGSGMAEIGICAHEHGHALGMPDLYDFSGTTNGNGFYSLMGRGLYTDPTLSRPSHPGPFDKQFYSWVYPTVAASGTNEYDLRPVEYNGDIIKVHPASGSGSEYFLIENRQHYGFNQPLSSVQGLCTGIYIWHIDEAAFNSYRLANRVVSLPSAGGPAHPSIAVVEADGGYDLINTPFNLGQCSDRWSVGRTFNHSSSPPATLWDGSNSGVSIQVLSQFGDTIRVRVTGAGSPVGYNLTARSRRAALLRGRLNFAGAPVVGETIELLRKNRGTGTFTFFSSTTTDGLGKYRFLGIPGGRYKTRVGFVESAEVRVRR